MSDDPSIHDHLLDEIADTHERFVELMNERLREVERRELELYLGILGKLVAKLEQRDKSLRSSAQEMFGEVASLVMAELAR